MTLIGTICYASLLMLNAIAILNEERFLARSLFPVFLMPSITIDFAPYQLAGRIHHLHRGISMRAFTNRMTRMVMELGWEEWA